ncbi:ATP synthase F1 subunit gamma [Paenibacillus campi]|uniref:ATP synthase F1 subunit gamma n=1 Tax=Paenibacillus campi TaxID=3106031 RepID=UPI002AFF278F|nr:MULTISPECIES: ATP synthase F1 subunit gamma [unclassified Paenibacillus]
MAKGMREIKRQIKSVQNTKQITKAMEMVAASKLRKAQEKAESARPYSEKLREVVTSIASGTKGIKHPMLDQRPVKRVAYLVVTSDRGLAGGYNANILRHVSNEIRQQQNAGHEYELFVIGRKGRDYFRRRGMSVTDTVTELTDFPTYADIKSLAQGAIQGYEEGRYDELYVCYNRFVNALTQTPTSVLLLPMDTSSMEKSTLAASYEYEPSAEEVLAELLPKYAQTLIYEALLEGKASEQGARMTAMGSATKNASQMINDLTLVYNRARQAAITQEISEIVAGANAQS